MSTNNMFLWRNKKNIGKFWLKIKYNMPSSTLMGDIITVMPQYSSDMTLYDFFFFLII